MSSMDERDSAKMLFFKNHRALQDIHDSNEQRGSVISSPRCGHLRLVPTNSSIINAHQVSGQVIQGNHISKQGIIGQQTGYLCGNANGCPNLPQGCNRTPRCFCTQKLQEGRGLVLWVSEQGWGSMTAWSPRTPPVHPFPWLPHALSLPSFFPIPPPPSPLSIALSVLLFLSTPAPLLSFPPLFSFPLLLPLPFSPSSYLIPLVFLLAACPADLHACCVEAAQLDLMPPAARSRAGSGLGAALPGRGREYSVSPTPWPVLWPLPTLPSALHPLPFQPIYPALRSCFHPTSPAQVLDPCACISCSIPRTPQPTSP